MLPRSYPSSKAFSKKGESSYWVPSPEKHYFESKAKQPGCELWMMCTSAVPRHAQKSRWRKVHRVLKSKFTTKRDNLSLVSKSNPHNRSRWQTGGLENDRCAAGEQGHHQEIGRVVLIELALVRFLACNDREPPKPATLTPIENAGGAETKQRERMAMVGRWELNVNKPVASTWCTRFNPMQPEILARSGLFMRPFHATNIRLSLQMYALDKLLG